MEQDSKHPAKAATHYHYLEGQYEFYKAYIRSRRKGTWCLAYCEVVNLTYQEMEHIAYAQRG